MKLNLISEKVYKKHDLNSLKEIIKKKCISLGKKLKKLNSENKLWKYINNYNYNHSILYIQALIRRKLAINRVEDMRAQQIDWKCNKSVNEVNLIGDKIEDIPTKYLFKYENHIFDLRELYQTYQHNKRLFNPYTNKNFPKKVEKQLQRIFLKLSKANDQLKIDNKIPEGYSLSIAFNNFYSKIEELGYYIDTERINNFNLKEFYDFMERILRLYLVKQTFPDEISLLEKEIYKIVNISEKYYSTYIINNYCRNPYLNYINYGTDSSIEIENNISEKEYLDFILNDYDGIEIYLKKCFKILDILLNHEDHKSVFALSIVECLEPIETIIVIRGITRPIVLI